MPFSAHDLRYHLEDYYASLYAYLHHRAQRYLGSLAFDAFEVDQVVGHVIEQLARFHILGGGDAAPKTALDNLTNAQFYAFLNRSAKNKAIDRLRQEFAALVDDAPLAHASQHKDHAHKKLRHCLQQSSSNLGVLVALRLSEYGVHATASNEITVDIQTLVQDNLSEKEVQTGLQHLVAEGLLDWSGEETIRLTSSQCKRLARFYEGE